MQDANGFAERLHLSAGLYHEQEQYVSNSLKAVWTAASDPYLTPEQVEQPSSSETFKDNAVSQVAGADYRAESFAEGPEAGRSGLVAGRRRGGDVDGDAGRAVRALRLGRRGAEGVIPVTQSTAQRAVARQTEPSRGQLPGRAP